MPILVISISQIGTKNISIGKFIASRENISNKSIKFLRLILRIKKQL